MQLKGNTYDIDYFLSNRYFIKWVNDPTPEAHAFWERWLKNHPGSQESFYQAKSVVERIQFKSNSAIGARKEAILDLIVKDQVSSRYKDKSVLHRAAPRLLRLVAACLIVGLISYFFLNQSEQVADASKTQLKYVSKHNPKGQKIGFYLPDKSWVVLNSDTKIIYPEKFEGAIREVTLEGEAYFDVVYDSLKTFLVHSGELVTEVHGTTFNVQAYPGESYRVALESGAVAVFQRTAAGSTPAKILVPGEMLELRGDFKQASISEFDFDQQFGWKEGHLVFRKANIKTLVKTLERWYNVQITISGHRGNDWMVSGSFQNETLKNVLEGIRYARNISYEINGNQVEIRL